MLRYRYRVESLPGTGAAVPGRYVIYDQVLDGYCTLPDQPGPHPNLLPLEWNSRAAAEAWLFWCRQKWQAGVAPAPAGALG